MNIQPLGDRIVLKRLDPILKSGRIFLPEVAQEKQLRCEVVAVGPGERDADYPTVRKPMQVQIGDVVIIGKYTDTDWENYVTAQQDDVRAIVNCKRDLTEADEDYAQAMKWAAAAMYSQSRLVVYGDPPNWNATNNRIETPIQPPKKLMKRNRA